MSFVLSLTQMLVLLSLYVMLSILLSILVCAAASLFCACLVSVQVSAPYVIAGSTQELYTCLFRQMARLLLKISRCLAYAAQPAMILRCISLSWFWDIFYQHIVHVYRGVVYNHYLFLCGSTKTFNTKKLYIHKLFIKVNQGHIYFNMFGSKGLKSSDTYIYVSDTLKHTFYQSIIF